MSLRQIREEELNQILKNHVLCILCKTPLELHEVLSLSEEFKNAPIHPECFDSFEDAEAFITFSDSLKIEINLSRINDSQNK